MVVRAITSLAEFRTIIHSENPAVIDFWATSCGLCSVISPIFEKKSDKVEGVNFYKVEVYEQDAISQEVRIKAMPTFILFHRGSRAGEVVAPVPSELEALIAKGVLLNK